MERISALLLTDLRFLIADLGKDGGLMGPSIYDTAQVLRLAPPEEGADAGLEWLLAQQRADGGWGIPNVPLARTVPTLAAVLTVAAYLGRAHPAVQRGLRFLAEQEALWTDPLPDDLPAGVELLAPHLLDEAAALGLAIPATYAPLRALGHRRRALLAQIGPRPGTTIAHSWEGWGTTAGTELLDPAGSLGLSPAATAAWLRAARGRADLRAEQQAAQRYLRRAASVTGAGVPGVVPTVWPIARFEQAFALYMLLIAGLLDHPALRDVVAPQVADMERAMRPEGLGFSDWFAPDGDDTAAACAVFAALGLPTHLDALRRFASGDRFCTWHGELQPAPSVTSHALHALRLAGGERRESVAYLLGQQRPDGRWLGDKWNRSWVYTTGQALIALSGQAPQASIERGVAALLVGQRPSGAWGEPHPTGEETAYAVLALCALQREGQLPAGALPALERAAAWLARPERAPDGEDVIYWLAKEPYRPQRVARICELAATALAWETLRRNDRYTIATVSHLATAPDVA
ncbi:MAG TPA: hypothetical protein VNL77_08090 [Roseiflexaceae bacterium]|nr:hypothetical protein [Roseiflexaceae bacterium]